VTLGGAELFRSLNRGAATANHSLLIEQKSAEIEELFLDPYFCQNGLQEVGSVPTNPKFCQGLPVPVRIRRDLGAIGPSAEDEILIPVDGDPGAQSMAMELRAQVTECKVTASDIDRAVIKLEIHGNQKASFWINRSMFIQLKYKAGDHSVVEECKTLAGSGGTAETDESICTDNLGGKWDPLATPTCRLAADSSWQKITDVTPLQVNKKVNSTHYDWTIDPAVKLDTPIDPEVCEFRLRIEYPKTTYKINQMLVAYEGANRFVERDTTTDKKTSGLRISFLKNPFTVGMDAAVSHFWKIILYDKVGTIVPEIQEFERVTFDSNVVFTDDSSTQKYFLEYRCH